ncbi:MAG TPA: alpha/beta hydrolase [Spirochaetota bacterium]|nr:alpha/beta hydrolase [Spirochaetota bacterium]HOD14856.1 alpha/beta hydrolase [Spirochaetota bacterium]HPN10656.1 alpha/beta hydrolase [Spirochaetota bacterium]HQL83729.1 alpha/beta hydrolase [Spirochaetota bacterium]
MSLKTTLNNFKVGIRPIPLEKLKEKFCDADSRFITIDGMDVHYRDQGKGPALVLLHGVCASLHTWDGWCEELKDRYRIIRLDVPGWGITGPSKNEEYMSNVMNVFFDKFFDAVGLDTFYLAGNSLGGYYSWSYAVHRPDRVKKLVLLDPIAYNQSLPYEFRLVQIPGTKFLVNNIMLPRLLIQTSIKRLYGRSERISDYIHDVYWELLMRKGNRRTLTKVFDMIATMSKSDTVYLDVKKIRMPVLMAWGKQDIWSRWKETIEEWKRDMPHAELVLYDNCGHMPMEEIPVESARDAHAFFMKKAAPVKTGNKTKPVSKKKLAAGRA